MKGKLRLSIFQAILLSFFLLCSFGTCYSAESTADVSADAELKLKLRQEILGNDITEYADEEYIVGHRDIVQVSIYGEGSMAAHGGVDNSSTQTGESGGNFLRGRGTGIEVRSDGRVSLRHIGDVSVIGMTLTQIADYLKKLYGTIYDNPSLTVTLVQSNSLQYTVMGQVKSPGLFHLDFPMTIVQAVARAGGFTEWANLEITVIRQKKGGKNSAGNGPTKNSYAFDYEKFLRGKNLEKNITIKQGDVLVVH